MNLFNEHEQCGLAEHKNQKIDYNQCISYLQHSSNYYCYLNDCEKQEIVIDKKQSN